MHEWIMLANAGPVPTPANNVGWLWLVVGLILGVFLRGKF